jgi:hypothetical protein
MVGGSAVGREASTRSVERRFRPAGDVPAMSLDDLQDDLEGEYTDLGDDVSVSLDRETRNELAMLEAAFDPEETDELLRRAVHMLFQTAVETGNLDFHLRSEYDVTYDEYLSGMTFDELQNGGQQFPQQQQKDDRRYQF